MLVPRYTLSMCHTPIKPDLLGFPGIGVFACGLRDHVITRFASLPCFELGKPKTKSIEMSTHGSLGTGKGIYKPCG